MEYRTPAPAGFDERAALEELERIRAEIERSKARRKELDEEFEAFIRSFKNPAAPRRNVAKPPPRPVLSRQERAAPEPQGEQTPAAMPPPASPVLPRRRPRIRPALLAGAATALAAAAWGTWMVGSRPPRSTGVALKPKPETPSAAPAPVAAVNPPAQPSSELTTSRAVWVRVIADGARVIERELPANARIPLTAQQTIVIRAGNAAAVRVTLAGKDQGALGPEGIAVTRTFTLDSR